MELKCLLFIFYFEILPRWLNLISDQVNACSIQFKIQSIVFDFEINNFKVKTSSNSDFINSIRF